MNDITVLIPVYKPGIQFDELIRRVSKQTLRPERIILLWTVANNENIEDIKAYIGRYVYDNIEVIYINQDEFDHGGTRAYGMSLVNTEYALLMTQDALPADNNLFENMLNSFDNESISAVYARQIPRINAGSVEKITREFNYPDYERIQNRDSLNKYGIKTYFCSNVCAMYKLSIYNEAGGFVKKTIFNEDMIIAAAMINKGYTVKYEPKARVIHSHHYTYMEQYKRNFDLAVSHIQYADVFDSVPAEGEGVRLVLTTAKKLIMIGKIYLIPDLILQSAFKYIGYRSGKNYTKYSKKGILKRTMNKSYWK